MRSFIFTMKKYEIIINLLIFVDLLRIFIACATPALKWVILGGKIDSKIRPQFSFYNRVNNAILIILEKKSQRKCLFLTILD